MKLNLLQTDHSIISCHEFFGDRVILSMSRGVFSATTRANTKYLSIRGCQANVFYRTFHVVNSFIYQKQLFHPMFASCRIWRRKYFGGISSGIRAGRLPSKNQDTS